MASAAIVILADTEGHGSLGRLVNGLETAREFVETDGDEAQVIFDGAGTQWIPELEDEAHDYNDLYNSIKSVAYACDYCSDAFGVSDAVAESDVVELDDHEGHPSIRSLVDDDFQVINY
jgi:hypothetical protein